MKNSCIISHPQFGKIRGVIVKGEVLFVIKDVCEVLGITKYHDVKLRLDNDGKGCSVLMEANSGPRAMATVNEAGLYNLMFQSRKPKVKQFRKWITSEGLPTIRRQGFYIHPSAMSTNKDTKQLQQLMLENVRKFIIEEDVRKCCRKFGFSDSYVGSIIRGTFRNNLVMNDLQERALINQEKWSNAYSADRMKEVIEKLTTKK